MMLGSKIIPIPNLDHFGRHCLISKKGGTARTFATEYGTCIKVARRKDDIRLLNESTIMMNIYYRSLQRYDYNISPFIPIDNIYLCDKKYILEMRLCCLATFTSIIANATEYEFQFYLLFLTEAMVFLGEYHTSHNDMKLDNIAVVLNPYYNSSEKHTYTINEISIDLTMIRYIPKIIDWGAGIDYFKKFDRLDYPDYVSSMFDSTFDLRMLMTCLFTIFHQHSHTQRSMHIIEEWYNLPLKIELNKIYDVIDKLAVMPNKTPKSLLNYLTKQK